MRPTTGTWDGVSPRMTYGARWFYFTPPACSNYGGDRWRMHARGPERASELLWAGGGCDPIRGVAWVVGRCWWNKDHSEQNRIASDTVCAQCASLASLTALFAWVTVRPRPPWLGARLAALTPARLTRSILSLVFCRNAALNTCRGPMPAAGTDSHRQPGAAPPNACRNTPTHAHDISPAFVPSPRLCYGRQASQRRRRNHHHPLLRALHVEWGESRLAVLTPSRPRARHRRR